MGFEFLHFGLLPYFLPLVGIPIVLHLLTLQRLRTVELSTFRFLFDSYIQQRRRMKFLEALIAMLRTAFLLVLVLMIARPIVSHWDALFGGGSGRDIVIMLDTSASMGATTDGVTSLERAKRTALQVVQRLGSDDRVTVVRVASQPEELCSRFSSDADAIADQIESLTATPSRANLFAAFSHVFGSDAPKLSKPLVYVFSDLQASGWTEFQDGQAQHLIPPDAELIVVNVGSTEQITNQAVVGSAPENQRAIVGLPITLRPGVANYSDTPANSSINILIEQKEIARTNVSLQPGETGVAEIIYTPTEAGVIRGRYEIEDDRFTHDNEFLFTISVAPRVRVLLVNGNPAAEPLENEAVYLRTAMMATEADSSSPQLPLPAAPPGATPAQGAPTVDQNTFARSLDVIEIPEPQLSVETLRDLDLAILSNCGALNADQFARLSDFVADGGGLLIFPGDRVNPDVYNQQFFTIPNRPNEPLVAAKLLPAEGDVNKAETFLRLAAIDYGHPVFSIFEDTEQRYFTKVNVYRRYPIEPTTGVGNLFAIAKFSDGRPAIVESRLGAGRVFLSAFPMHTRWGNLPLRPEFVPFVLCLIRYSQRPADLEGPAVVEAEAAAELAVNQSWAPASAKVTDVSGRVTPLSFVRSNARLMASFPHTLEQGYYTVDITGGRAEAPKHGSLAFAVNVPAGESNFQALTAPQISTYLPSAKITTVDASAEAQQAHGGVGREVEIWRWLIALLFVIIGVEFFLSTIGGRLDDGEDAPTAGQRIRDIVQASWVRRITGAETEQEVQSGTSA